MSRDSVQIGDRFWREGDLYQIVDIHSPSVLILSKCSWVNRRLTYRFTMTGSATIRWDDVQWIAHGGTLSVEGTLR